MIRVVAFLIGVLALGAGLAWLADRPGAVVLTWQGYEIRTSVMAMMLMLLAATAVLIILWTIYRWIVDGPRALGDYFRSRRRVRGYEALSRGMIAVGAGDTAYAGQQAKQARKLLAREPLVGLLMAQSAQLSGNLDGAKAAFTEMLADPDTALLGLHGLYVEARRAGDAASAARHADDAVSRAPGLAWAAEAALAARVAESDWEGALSRLETNFEHRLIDKPTRNRHRAVLLTAKARGLEEREPETALAAAQEAHKLAPALVPAAVIAGRMLASDGKTGPASSALEKTWKLAAHPDIAAIYAHVRSGDSVRDRLKRVKALAGKNQGNVEGAVALANAAIEALDWTAARGALEPLLAREPSQRVCLLMAEIEDGEHGDRGKVREWFARAIRAPRDPAWVADGHVSDAWAPASPVTGALDAYEWRVPDENVAPPEAAVLDWRPAGTPVAAPDDVPMLIDVTEAAEPAGTEEGPPLADDAVVASEETKPASASPGDDDAAPVIADVDDVAEDTKAAALPDETPTRRPDAPGAAAAAAVIAAAQTVQDHDETAADDKVVAAPPVESANGGNGHDTEAERIAASRKAVAAADASGPEPDTVRVDTVRPEAALKGGPAGNAARPGQAGEKATEENLDQARGDEVPFDEATPEEDAATPADEAAALAAFPTRAPDDPGPLPDDEAPRRKWFGLF